LNPIGILEQVIEKIKEGEKIVYAKRENFGFDNIRARVSDTVVRLGSMLFGVDGFYTGKTNIAAYSRTVADVIIALPDRNKYLRTMNTWIGWDIFYMSYASGYNKVEEKNLLADIKHRIKNTPMVKSVKPIDRDRIREHTASIDLSWGLLFIAFVLALFGIVYPIWIGSLWWVHAATWIGVALALLTSLLLIMRAVLIKRVGIVHSIKTPRLYEIKNVVK
jgi:hypothetical protein